MRQEILILSIFRTFVQKSELGIITTVCYQTNNRTGMWVMNPFCSLYLNFYITLKRLSSADNSS